MILILLLTGCNSNMFFSSEDQDPKIIFSSWFDMNQELFLIDLNTNHKTQITSDTSGYAGLLPSPDGKEVLFSITHLYTLFKLNVETEETQELSNEGDILEYEWSPDGSQIAFTRRTHYILEADLFVIDRNGENERQITFLNDFVDEIDWSPDGQYLVYSYTQNQRTVIYIIPAAGGEPTLITGDSIHGTDVDWSPTSNEILYTCNEGEETYVCAINVDTKESVKIALGHDGKWSPDGNFILFILPRSDLHKSDITTIKRDSTEQRTWDEGTDAVWSKDGKCIAYYKYHRWDNLCDGYYDWRENTSYRKRWSTAMARALILQ